jgi:hypothetical protein
MIMELNLTGIHALIAIFLIAIGSVEILDKVSDYFNINKYILRTIFIIYYIKKHISIILL